MQGLEMCLSREWPVVLTLVCCSRTRLGEPCLKTYPLECVDLLRRARIAFHAGRTLKESFRLAQLEAVVRMLEEHECDFVDALGRDLHKVRVELLSSVIFVSSTGVIFINRSVLFPDILNRLLFLPN